MLPNAHDLGFRQGFGLTYMGLLFSWSSEALTIVLGITFPLCILGAENLCLLIHYVRASDHIREQRFRFLNPRCSSHLRTTFWYHMAHLNDSRAGLQWRTILRFHAICAGETSTTLRGLLEQKPGLLENMALFDEFLVAIENAAHIHVDQFLGNLGKIAKLLKSIQKVNT